MVPLLDLNSGTLRIVLSHEHEWQRAETEALLLSAGGQYTDYPEGPLPPIVAGGAVFCDGTLSVTAGGVTLVGPLGFTIGEVALMKQAVLYVNDRPAFDPDAAPEKTWLAARLALDILESDQK